MEGGSAEAPAHLLSQQCSRNDAATANLIASAIFDDLLCTELGAILQVEVPPADTGAPNSDEAIVDSISAAIFNELIVEMGPVLNSLAME